MSRRVVPAGRAGGAGRPRRGAGPALALALSLGAVLAAAPAAAADAQAGKAKAASCTVCHGPQGLATAPETPNLAGQPAGYLATQLQHFRSGARKHEVMNVIAKPLSNDDIANLAAWFASQEVQLKSP